MKALLVRLILSPMRLVGRIQDSNDDKEDIDLEMEREASDKL